MATATRRTSIANPAKKRKKNRARKNLSAKQIKFFGTPAQKAALKRSRKAKRKNTAKRHTTKPRRKPAVKSARKAAKRNTASHRPRTRPRAKKRATTKRRNSGTESKIYHFVMGPRSTQNPAGGKMATTKKRRKTHAHRSNKGRSKRRNGRVHRNPFGGSFSAEIMSAIFALAGFVGSKFGAQAVLGGSNTGPMGYAANLAIGGVGAWIIGGPMKNKKGAASFFTGSVIEVIARIIQDMTPFGQYVSGIAGVGDAGVAGFGAYMPSNWVTPQRYLNPARSAQVQIPNGWAPTTVIQSAAPPAGQSAGAGMGTLYGSPRAHAALY